MNVLTTEHKNLSSNPTKNDRAVTAIGLLAIGLDVNTAITSIWWERNWQQASCETDKHKSVLQLRYSLLAIRLRVAVFRNLLLISQKELLNILK